MWASCWGRVWAADAGCGVLTLQVLHLYGTPYEMGVAYGELMGKEIKTMFPQFYAYVEEQLGE